MENKRSSIKFNGEDTSMKKHIVWDDESLREQELERKRNPRQKINDPDTPYAGNVYFLIKNQDINSDDDDYLINLKTINKIPETVINKFFI